MAVIIESSYGKTIGLPGYSSHKFNLSIKTEVSDLAQIAPEAERVYTLLQQAVDDQMAHPKFLPGANGTNGAPHPHGSNGNGTNGNGTNGNGSGDYWNCSDKQRDLILKIVAENHLDKAEINELARLRFGAGVKELNKLAASGLIDELLEKYGGPASGKGGRRYQNGNGRRSSYAGRRRG